jgi:hypothetical protein
MTMTVGRFGLGASQGDTIIKSVSTSGKTVSVRGLIGLDPGPALDATAEQINALADDPFEDFIPVTFDHAPRLNGYYYVTGASVELGEGSLITGWWPFSIELTRVANFTSPLIEASMLGALRPNSQSVTAAIPWHAVPATSSGYGFLSSAAVSRVTRESVDGTLNVFNAGTFSPFYNSFTTFTLPPANFYDGAATVNVGAIAPINSTVYGPTGAVQTYVVPSGVTQLSVVVLGAQGGGPSGGKGARIAGTLTVTPGATYDIYVGARATSRTGGYNGGANGGLGAVAGGINNGGQGWGGGGASDIRPSGGALAARLVCAGGGGGSGGWDPYSYTGGAGGTASGGAAANPDGIGGKGASRTAGGAAGVARNFGNTGSAGTLGVGGVGANSSATPMYGAGGGGGGWYGGGGGSGGGPSNLGYMGGSAGGGSGNQTSAMYVTNSSWSYQTGDGGVFITPLIPNAGSAVTLIDRYTVIGNDAPDQPFGWELTNGVVRIAPNYRAGEAVFDLQVWNGAAWSTRQQWRVTENGSTGTTATLNATGFSVLRNNAEECTIRASYEYGATADNLTATWTLRRGAFTADLRLDCTASKSWGLRNPTVGAAATTLTGNASLLAVDADGNQGLLISPDGSTTATTSAAVANGAYATTNRYAINFGVGIFSPGSTTTAQAVSQWYAAQTVTLRPVMR